MVKSMASRKRWTGKGSGASASKMWRRVRRMRGDDVDQDVAGRPARRTRRKRARTAPADGRPSSHDQGRRRGAHPTGERPERCELLGAGDHRPGGHRQNPPEVAHRPPGRAAERDQEAAQGNRQRHTTGRFEMSADWKSIVRTVAPQLASMFGTPLAGMAVSAIANVLLPGKPNPTEADVAQAVMGLAPADLVKL